MTTRDFEKFSDFIVEVSGKKQEITGIYCSDLLSWAMTNLPIGSVWCTVVGNINTIAVATLTGVCAIILCEGAILDTDAKQKAEEQNITVVYTSLPTFQAGVSIAKQGHLPL